MVSNVDGKQILSLKDFSTSNGPDVRVYLVKGNSPDHASVTRQAFLDLGVIKGNQGNQNYTLPKYIKSVKSVQIWCSFAEVNLGEAKFPKPIELK